jgi:hypothetical protein
MGMTKKQIFQQASDLADEYGLSTHDKSSFLILVINSPKYRDAPYDEPTLQEQLETAVQGIIDQCNSPEGFFSNLNRNKK